MNGDRNALVSIVIPTYNRKNVIGRAVDSCLKQTYHNIEIVVCDDHSADGTLDYLRDRYKHHRNIRYCVTPIGEKGANAARNEGIKNARGRFIAFLDSDDCLTEDSIETRLNVILSSKCALVYGDVYYRTGNSKILKFIQYDDISGFNQKKYLVQELSLCTTSSIMVRKCVFEEVGYLDESLLSWQDDDLVVSIGMRYRLQHCQKPVAVIIDSKKSIMKNHKSLYQGCKGIVKKHKEEIIKYDSYLRYYIWRIRILGLWAKYKEQEAKGLYGRRMIYDIIYSEIDKFVVKAFRHIYV